MCSLLRSYGSTWARCAPLDVRCCSHSPSSRSACARQAVKEARLLRLQLRSMDGQNIVVRVGEKKREVEGQFFMLYKEATVATAGAEPNHHMAVDASVSRLHCRPSAVSFILDCPAGPRGPLEEPHDKRDRQRGAWLCFPGATACVALALVRCTHPWDTHRSK